MSDYTIEAYGGGWIIADYSGNRGKFGAAYRGRSAEWHDQPIVNDPFAKEYDAQRMVAVLEDLE
jgi:hypothetical protein